MMAIFFFIAIIAGAFSQIGAGDITKALSLVPLRVSQSSAQDDSKKLNSTPTLSLSQEIRSSLPSMPHLHLTTWSVGLKHWIRKKLSSVPSSHLLHGTPVAAMLPDNVWNIITEYEPLWKECYRSETDNTLLQTNDSVESAGFSPDTTRILTMSDKQRLFLWDAKTKKSIKSKISRFNSASACFSTDGTQILTITDLSNTSDQKTSFIGDGHLVTKNHQACLWNANNGKLVGTFDKGALATRAAALSHDNTRLITTDMAYCVSLWRAQDKKLIARLPSIYSQTALPQFSNDSRYIVTANVDNIARLWKADDGAHITTLTGHRDEIISTCFSPDNKYIATGSYDRTTRLWDTHTGACIKILSGHSRPVDSVLSSKSLRASNTRIVTTSWDSTGCLWNAQDGAYIATLTGHSSDISAQFNHDGTRILTRSKSPEEIVRLWDAKDGSLIKLIKHGTVYYTAIHSAHFNLDGTQIITGDKNGTLCLWNAEDGSLITTLVPSLLGHHDVCVKSAQFNHNGTQIMAIHNNNDREYPVMQIWEKIQL